MSGRIYWMLCIAIVSVVCGGCWGQAEGRKPTYPVTGVVIVDGSPAEGVQVVLNDVKGMDKNNPTFSQTFTDKEGKFVVSTYEKGDGVPEGEYSLTFFWGQINGFTMHLEGPDKLKDKYTDPAQSTHKIKVEKGKPANMGRIELTTH